MDRENSDIITKRYINRVLYLAGVVILALIVIAACSFSYAKYISSKNSDNNAGVASVGIEVFRMVAPEDDDYEWTMFNNWYSDIVIGEGYSTIVEYNQVVPGADIPAPYIELKIHSEVSYRLYVRIKVSGDIPHNYGMDDYEIIDFLPDVDENNEDAWSEVSIQEAEKIYTYESNRIYKAGTKYGEKDEDGKFTGEPLKVSILKNDVIFVSQYYGRQDEYNDGINNTLPFTIEFEAFIRQVLE